MEQATTLYRLYDSTDRLLYVGIANNWLRRMSEHRKTKAWWSEVARLAMEHFESRQQAEEAERAAIKSEHPVHNVVHALNVTHHQIEWRCGHCGHAIEDGDGYVDLSWSDFRWLPTHRRCDTALQSSRYWIAIERIRTLEQLDQWEDHLGRKRWFVEHDWDDIKRFMLVERRSA